MGFIHLFNGLVLLNLLGQSSGSSGHHVFFTRFQGGFSICFRPIQLEIFRASQPATALATHLLETSGISRWVFCEANQWIYHCNLWGNSRNLISRTKFIGKIPLVIHVACHIPRRIPELVWAIFLGVNPNTWNHLCIFASHKIMTMDNKK